MSIQFNQEIPSKEDFYQLFITTGWNDEYQLNPDDLYLALKNSWFMVCAVENERLVGFGRIICDGMVHALILDLIVHPEFQQKGIGGEILERLVIKCQEFKIRDIQLFSAKGKASFYEKRGFVLRKEDAPGMEFSHQN